MAPTAHKSPSHIDRYAPAEAQGIIEAYREIFPRITPELACYWDLERTRAWSYLTSDFHRAKLCEYEAFSVAVEKLQGEARNLPAAELAERMIALCRIHDLGFSFGIGPWTDHALHRTYARAAGRRLIIIVGHDWYPIVPKRMGEPHPLNWPMRQDGLHRMPEVLPGREKLYYAAVTEPLLSGDLGTLLFVNIFPDYRAPEERTTGKVKAGYAGCLEGFEALLAATRPHYSPDDVTIMSWGMMPWELLKQRTPVRRPGTIMEITEQLAGEILEFRTRGHAYRYLPVAHPSERRNAHIDFHLDHIRLGFANLGFGTPMSVPAPRPRPIHWRPRGPLAFIPTLVALR
ncbi:hypothetical protein LH704_21100 [Burkholderia cenocepacia]|uniref:hypothetical protein n=1 Tax=Burkholderia cenocepacia TaxID=95486 RepID=UPI001F27F528|nr:hypothetical protein [Burkholderia cenocepacia]MCF1369266.1 hypothetical protein [Burkholderia cenocepacia]MCF1386703.1 hypothetical protein [Burkholderia cenocepacia]